MFDEGERATPGAIARRDARPRRNRVVSSRRCRRFDVCHSLRALEVFVESHDGQRVVLDITGPGELLGELSLLDSGPRTASAVTLEDCELLVMDRPDLVELVGRHPHAAIAMLTVVGQRLRATDDLLRSHVPATRTSKKQKQ